MKFWSRFWLLLAYAGVGLLVSLSLFVVFSFVTQMVDSGAHVLLGMHVVQWAQNILVMMLMPMLWMVTVWYRDRLVVGNRWRAALGQLGLLRTDWRMMFLVVLLSVCSIPLMDAVEVACMNFPLPEAWRAALDGQYAESQRQIAYMLQPTGVCGWIELVLLMCVSTAVGEEIMFRGALLKCFTGYTRLNAHVVAWTVGLIFAVVHLDLIGLVPRWLLGALFVYLVYWSGSLWPSILAHLLNNLWALYSYKTADPAELLQPASECSFGPVLIVMSALLTVLLLVRMYRSRVVKED